jgi:hypothetical protein
VIDGGLRLNTPSTDQGESMQRSSPSMSAITLEPNTRG